jgi:hypothetical protein
MGIPRCSDQLLFVGVRVAFGAKRPLSARLTDQPYEYTPLTIRTLRSVIMSSRQAGLMWQRKRWRGREWLRVLPERVAFIK